MIDAIVTGRSLPALQTALDLAEVGLRVAVLNDAATPNTVKSWAERDPDGSIAAFISRIAEPIDWAGKADAAGADSSPATCRDAHKRGSTHLKHEGGSNGEAVTAVSPFVKTIRPSSPMLWVDGAWLAQSSPEMLGVPAVPLAAENIATLGAGGAFRTYLDRVTPLLTVGKTRLFGELVRKRMGAKVRTRLVDPQVYERYGVLADDVEVAIAATGLNEALSRSGALSSAVLACSDRNVARETRVSPACGAAKFHTKVLQRLALYDVQLIDASAVTVQPDEEGWSVALDDGGTMQARALVADVGENPIVRSPVREVLGQLAAQEARLHANIDIDVANWAVGHPVAIALVGEWSVLFEESDSEEPASGSSQTAESQRKRITVRASSGVKSINEVIEFAETLNRVNRFPVALAALGVQGEQKATGITVRLSAAPFRTVSHRAEAAASLALCEQQRAALLPVGRAVHGDDQGAALTAAHRSAVRLRRRLLDLD